MSIKPKKRFAILMRDGFKCGYCGRSSPEVELQVDHKIAKSIGGGDNDDNLLTSCRECNAGKRTVIVDEDIVFILDADGSIDHEKSLKRNGLWNFIGPNARAIFSRPIEVPHSVQAYDFRARAHAWFSRRADSSGDATCSASGKGAGSADAEQK